MIRKAQTSDSRQITKIQLEAWQKAYKHFLPMEFLSSLSLPARELRWKVLLQQEEDIYVSESEGIVVGFVHFIVNLTTERAEVIRLYVAPQHWRSGVGSNLFKYMLEALDAVGVKELFLWVAEENHFARSFYEKKNMKRVGGLRRLDAFSVDGTPLPEINALDPERSSRPEKGEFSEVQYRLTFVDSCDNH